MERYYRKHFMPLESTQVSFGALENQNGRVGQQARADVVCLTNQHSFGDM